MTRRLRNLLTAPSLLLCAAVVALWVRSHWRWDFFEGGMRSASGEHRVLTAWTGGVAGGGVTIGRRTEVWLMQRPPWLNQPPPRWAWETISAEQAPAFPAASRAVEAAR